MYLPLAAVITIVVVCGYTLGKRILPSLMSSNRQQGLLGHVIGYALAGAVIVILGLLSIGRNFDYRSVLSIWQDTVSKRPSNFRAHGNLGSIYSSNGEYEKAINYYNEALRLNPGYPKTHNNRGDAYRLQGNYDRGIWDFDRAIEFDPNYADAHYNRGLAYLSKGEYGPATRDLDQAIKLNPNSARAYNDLAWILATHKDSQARDGARAVQLAKKACDLTDYKSPAYLDTLAGAYAQLGQFDRAVKNATKALQLARDRGEEELAKDILGRLKLYKAKRPYPDSK